MSETRPAEKDTKEWTAAIVYGIFLLFWVVACILFGTLFGEDLFTTWWLVVPFVAGTVWIAYVGLEAYYRPLPKKRTEEETEEEQEEHERQLFAWIVRYTQNVILAITIVLLVAVYTEHRISVPDDDLLACFIYGFSALAVAASFILPFPWLKDAKATRILRHIKTAAYLVVVGLFSSSIIALAVGIYRALYVG